VNILFRCDAHPQVGLGHLGRSIGLAEALRHLGHSCFFLGQWDDVAQGMLEDARFTYHEAPSEAGSSEDARSTARLAASLSASLVADSYSIRMEWVLNPARREVPTAMIDDFAALPDYTGCRAVLNFRIGAERMTYRGLSSERLATGPGFFCARDKLRELRDCRTPSKPPWHRILLFLGASDRHGRAQAIYDALIGQTHPLEIRVLLSSEAAASFRHRPGEVLILPSRMEDHYAWCDACICGGGLVKYECAYLGLPVAMFSQTEEQQTDSEIFCAAGWGFNLAPEGDTSSWPDRLALFLQSATFPDHLSGGFSSQSPDRSARHIEHWLGVPN